jgi:Zn-dependent protease with chaperone function
MPFLLMILLTLVCLPGPGGWPAPLGIESSAWSVSWTMFGVAFVGGYAWWVNHRLAVALDSPLVHRSAVVRRYERQRFIGQLFMLGSYVLAMVVFGWGWTVAQLAPAGAKAGGEFPGAELLLLSPFLVAQLLCWMWEYDADRALHAHPKGGDQAAAAPPPARGGRLAYVIFQARQKLALVFLPILLLIILKEGMRLIPRESWEEWEGVADVAACLLLLTVFITLPLMVRFALGLKPLPDSPIRQRLLAAAKRLHFRCSGLMLWNTRSGMANAMVIGIVPWIRYVVFTDRLLEEFSPDEVEAVFGHEVGHIKHQHMLYYFGFLLVSFAVLHALAMGAALVLRRLFPGDGTWGWLATLPDTLSRHNQGYLAILPMIGVLLSYIFVVFGFLSRRCERQADVFGCKAVSCGSPICFGHTAEVALPQGPPALCPTGIQTFIAALEKVAQVNGINRDRPGFLHSWQHSTIGRRVAFLQQLLFHPEIEEQFQRRVRLVKWAMFLTLCCTLAILYATSGF